MLKLWKPKEPISTSYIEDNQEKNIIINHKNVFISDGVVDDTTWKNLNGKKILFLLKEAYGENNDWSLTDWLLTVKPSSSNWKRVIEWTYGIQNTNEITIAKYYPDIFNNNKDLFNQIAVVNFKKSGVKSHSIYGEIEAYAISDKEEIKKTIGVNCTRHNSLRGNV